MAAAGFATFDDFHGQREEGLYTIFLGVGGSLCWSWCGSHSDDTRIFLVSVNSHLLYFILQTKQTKQIN
jgi:hypothetical protein